MVFGQDILRQSCARRSHQPATCWLLDPAIAMLGCGIFSPRLPLTHFLDTKDGYSAWSGKRWKGSLLQVDTTDMYVDRRRSRNMTSEVETDNSPIYATPCLGPSLGSENWKTHRRRVKRPLKMGNLPFVGTNTPVSESTSSNAWLLTGCTQESISSPPRFLFEGWHGPRVVHPRATCRVYPWRTFG